MDHQLIYLRSPAGEDAMAQRTRIVQRNLRNVLDLVDGKRTVEDIIKKFGDASIAEAALADLERSGFIETPEGRKLRESGAVPGAVTPPPPEGPRSDPSSGDKNKQKPNLKAEAFGDHFDDEDITVMDPLEFPGMTPGEPASGGASTGAPRSKAPWEDDEELSELASGAAPPPEYRVPVFADDEAARDKSGEKGRKFRAPPTWGSRLKVVAFSVLGLALVVAAVVVFFPYDSYLPRVELDLRSSAGEPVRLGKLGFSFDPQPNITLERLSFGSDQAVKVAVVKAFPEFSTLLATTKRLREVHLRHVEMDARALPRFVAWINGGVLGPRYFVTQKLRFSDLALKLGDMTIEGIAGEVNLDGNGKVKSVSFANGEGNLKGELQAGSSPQIVRFSASEWTVPSHDWVKLITLDAQGVIATGGLRIDKFDARAFNGIVAGAMLFNWADGGEVTAQVELRRVSAEQLLAKLRPGFALQGEVNGKIRIVGKSKLVADVTGHLDASGPIEVQRGLIPGVDFVEAVRSRNPGPTRGGQTRFEQLSAEFATTEHDWRFTELKIGAGLMQANGALTIGEENLSGSALVQFGGGSQLRATVSIGGTVKDPWLSARR